jgi:rhodanese-related sulfurtransferase
LLGRARRAHVRRSRFRAARRSRSRTIRGRPRAGARNLPHRKIVAGKLGDHPADTLFVVYCAGPHCNGAARAAIRLARLGRPVKLMIGGIAGWRDEGFALSNDAQMETGAMN